MSHTHTHACLLTQGLREQTNSSCVSDPKEYTNKQKSLCVSLRLTKHCANSKVSFLISLCELHPSCCCHQRNKCKRQRSNLPPFQHRIDQKLAGFHTHTQTRGGRAATTNNRKRKEEQLSRQETPSSAQLGFQSETERTESHQWLQASRKRATLPVKRGDTR